MEVKPEQFVEVKELEIDKVFKKNSRIYKIRQKEKLGNYIKPRN
jgi:hypothetical protein